MLGRIAVALLLASASITGVAPNPASHGDSGEFVTVHFAEPTNTSGWTLRDGETAARLPNETLSGTVALSTTPEAARNRTDLTVVPLSGSLSLSNGGERIELHDGTRTRSTFTYPDAPEAERWNGSEWTPLGATNFPIIHTTNVSTAGFLLPDAPGPPLALLRSADSRLYLAGYTLTADRVTTALVRAAERGVDVRVLVDGAPVGGMPAAEAAQLNALVAAGVEVRVLDGDRARYSFHHAKYAVADDRAVVLSENWKPSGTGGHANRGWGVTLRDARVADQLARVFQADSEWADGKNWTAVRQTQTLVESETATESFPTRFPPVEAVADSVRILLAPDNAKRGVREFVASANESLYVEQVRIDPESEFLNWTVDAARRGTTVRVLLSGAWYVREENRNVTQRLNRIGNREGLDIRAKLVAPRSRFEKIHVKGAVVDGQRALVGSLNWNTHAATENREVAVIVQDDRIARYYERAFRADWRGGAWRLQVGVGVVVAATALVAGLVARRIEFEGEQSGVEPE